MKQKPQIELLVLASLAVLTFVNCEHKKCLKENLFV